VQVGHTSNYQSFLTWIICRIRKHLKIKGKLQCLKPHLGCSSLTNATLSINVRDCFYFIFWQFSWQNLKMFLLLFFDNFVSWQNHDFITIFKWDEHGATHNFASFKNMLCKKNTFLISSFETYLYKNTILISTFKTHSFKNKI